MAIDMEQVRAAIEPDEPNYPKAAQELGPEALPHLESIITGDHTGLAAKAAYLAGLIGTPQSMSAIEKAARSSQPAVRIAAASAARHLAADQSDALLLQLVDDGDAGVRKVALRSAANAASDTLRARVAAVAQADSTPAPRAASRPARGRAKKAVRRSAKKTRAATSAKKKSRTARAAAKKVRRGK